MILLGGVPISALNDPSWFEHVDLMQVVLGILLLYLIWTIKVYAQGIKHDISVVAISVRKVKDTMMILTTEHTKNHPGSAIKVSALFETQGERADD